ncbi:non-homologous end joining protein Ku [Pedobacter sp. AW31-3R]|uniref:non-homologous end joining protein Ku n=1 Tax=Pedobacter sp. AW31-3R TaxID=3445781 RepID=UPI003F9EDCAE
MRSLWNGSIGFGLVNIPVKLFSAVQNSHLDLDMLDSKDHSRIKFKRVNENSKKEVAYDNIVKGYLLDEKYVVLEDKDFENASPEKTKMIELENFVDIHTINPIYYETSYYAQPEKQGKKAYALLLNALRKSNKAGLGRFVLRSTENLCVIHPLDKVLVVTKIRFEEEIRPYGDLEIPVKSSVTEKELKLGLSLIEQYTADFDIKSFKDEYNSELMKIIKSKAKGKKSPVRKAKPKQETDDDLYGQLMQSLNNKKKS